MNPPMYAILKNKQVVPCTFEEWSQWIDATYVAMGEVSAEEARRNFIAKRQVANDVLPGDIRVSTVFLGINHGFCPRPLWFETMVFGGKFDGSMHRYERYEEAEAGHLDMISTVLGKEHLC